HTKALPHQIIPRQIVSMLTLKGVEHRTDKTMIEIISTQIAVAGGGEYFKNVAAKFEERDVEGAAAEVVNCDALAAIVTVTIGKRCGRWLVHQAQNLQSSQLTGPLGGAP